MTQQVRVPLPPPHWHTRNRVPEALQQLAEGYGAELSQVRFIDWWSRPPTVRPISSSGAARLLIALTAR
jgi:hypothetical protein